MIPIDIPTPKQTVNTLKPAGLPGKLRRPSAAEALARIARLRVKANQITVHVRQYRRVSLSGGLIDEFNQHHSSFTRQLAFGDSTHWEKPISRSKSIEKFFCNRCTLRLGIVLIVFFLACMVYYLRMKEHAIDRELRELWIQKNINGPTVVNTDQLRMENESNNSDHFTRSDQN